MSPPTQNPIKVIAALDVTVEPMRKEVTERSAFVIVTRISSVMIKERDASVFWIAQDDYVLGSRMFWLQIVVKMSFDCVRSRHRVRRVGSLRF